MDTKVLDGKERLVDVMSKAGITVRDLTAAYLGQDGGLKTQEQRLDATAEANEKWLTS